MEPRPGIRKYENLVWMFRGATFLLEFRISRGFVPVYSLDDKRAFIYGIVRIFIEI